MNRKSIAPYQGGEPYIFLSYSHIDIKTAMEIVYHLQADGYRVWYDEGIDPGTEWDENIAFHVENCSFFMALLSNNYLQSTNCKDELNYARDLNKNRLIIYLEDIALPGGMQMRLGRLQAIHKYKYEEQTNFYEKLYASHGISDCVNNMNESYWEGFPDELRQMMSVAFRSHDYTIDGLKKFLNDEIDLFDYGEKSGSTNTSRELIVWIDRVFEDAMYPLEFVSEQWEKNKSAIEKILHKADELIQRYTLSGYRASNRKQNDDREKYNYVKFENHLDVYFCTLYAFTKNWDELDKRLSNLIEGTMRNVRHLITLDNPQKEIETDEWGKEFHYPGMYSWLPINWLLHEYIIDDDMIFEKHIANAYESYIKSLYALLKETSYKSAVTFIIGRAEKSFQGVCESICDSLEDCIEDECYDSSEQRKISAVIEMYKQKILKSNMREKQF